MDLISGPSEGGSPCFLLLWQIVLSHCPSVADIESLSPKASSPVPSCSQLTAHSFDKH